MSLGAVCTSKYFSCGKPRTQPIFLNAKHVSKTHRPIIKLTQRTLSKPFGVSKSTPRFPSILSSKSLPSTNKLLTFKGKKHFRRIGIVTAINILTDVEIMNCSSVCSHAVWAAGRTRQRRPSLQRLERKVRRGVHRAVRGALGPASR